MTVERLVAAVWGYSREIRGAGEGDETCTLSIRQHTSAYVSIRQRMSAVGGAGEGDETCTVTIRQHTSAYVGKRQHASEYVRITN
jgi:hypothetical protein